MVQPTPPSSKPADTLKASAAAAGGAVAAVGTSTMKAADRAWHFIDGTIRGCLNYCSRYGRRGLWVGVAAGVAAMIIPGGVAVAGAVFSGFALPFYGALAGGLAGAVLGAVTGAIRGGVDRLALENRKEKYSRELEERRGARSVSSGRRVNNRAYDTYRDNIDRINYDKIDQYNDRLNLGGGSSWAERVDASRDDSQITR